METFVIQEWYQMAKGDAFVGVDLLEDRSDLDELLGAYVTLKIGERSKLVKVTQVEPPFPHHIPPYRKGERIGLRVEFEEAK